MRPALTLVVHSAARARWLVGGFGLLLLVFQVLFVLLAVTLQESNTFARIAEIAPPFVRELLGSSFVTMMSFSGVVGFGYFHPMILAALVGVAIAVATEPAAEIERRFVDVILARPAARADVVTRSAILLAAATVLLVGAMVAGTWLALATLVPAGAPPVREGLIESLAANLAALVFCWGGLTLALAARGRRRGAVGAVAAGLAFSTFLVNYLARVWAPVAKVAWLMPFHYYDPMAMLLGAPLPVAHLWTLGGIGLAGVVVAYWVYGRRDL